MRPEPSLIIKAKDDSMIHIYGNLSAHDTLEVIKVAPDGTESACDQQDFTAALIDAIVAAIPFSQAYTDCRGLHEPEDGHPNRDTFQNFLDSNTVTPSGTTVGDWRRLADVVITKPANQK